MNNNSIAQQAYSPAFLQVLNKYKAAKIIHIKVVRVAVNGWIEYLLNLLSSGSWEQVKKEQGFDKFFHVSLVLTMPNGHSLNYEKLAIPTLTLNIPNGESMTTSNPTTTIGEFIQKHYQSTPSTYFGYNVLGDKTGQVNNCQTFAIDALRANDILTQPIEAFTLQDIQAVAGQHSHFLKDLTKKITDLGSLYEFIY